MADTTVDTTAANYLARHQQFKDIVDFYKPRIRAYHKLADPAMQEAFRSADPFLNDLLRFANAVTNGGGKEL